MTGHGESVDHRAALVATYGQKAVDNLMAMMSVCDILQGFAKAGREQFLTDLKTQWAVEMGLIRIGEAVGRVPEQLLKDFPDQPWRQIIAMRNFAAHQYDDLQPARVWTTLTRDVPQLRTYVHDIVLEQSPK